jgi:hypothetical protein
VALALPEDPQAARTDTAATHAPTVTPMRPGRR